MIVGTLNPVHKKAIKTISKRKNAVKRERNRVVDLKDVKLHPAYILAMGELVREEKEVAKIDQSDEVLNESARNFIECIETEKERWQIFDRNKMNIGEHK